MQRPLTGHAYLDEPTGPSWPFVAMAHRGGARHPDLEGLENTATAFRHAHDLGYRYLETDVHATADGSLIAFHDGVLDRVTDRAGAVADVPVALVRSALIAGTEPIPFFADLLEEFADSRFNVDLKSAGAVPVLADLLDVTGAHDRVCVGSFSMARLSAFRRRTGGRVATSASPAEVAAFVTLPWAAAVRRLMGARVCALQVPAAHAGLPIITAGLVRRAHRVGAQVHAWTIDDPSEMNRLIDLGVDGLITDRTDLLREVLRGRGMWKE